MTLVRAIFGLLAAGSFCVAFAQEMNLHTIAIGNPGAGKSTILNGLVEFHLFNSGVSIGSGMTTLMDKKQVGGKFYVDTPGLADANLREQAAREIEKALKLDGYYKIFFVVLVDSGRVRAADKVMMDLVLNAITTIRVNEFGIIVNKMPQKTKRRLLGTSEQSQAEYSMLLTTLLNGTKWTDHVFLNANDPELEDETDIVKPIPQDLRQFMMNLPPIVVQKEDVNRIDIEWFDIMLNIAGVWISTLTAASALAFVTGAGAMAVEAAMAAGVVEGVMAAAALLR